MTRAIQTAPGLMLLPCLGEVLWPGREEAPHSLREAAEVHVDGVMPQVLVRNAAKALQLCHVLSWVALQKGWDRGWWRAVYWHEWF